MSRTQLQDWSCAGGRWGEGPARGPATVTLASLGPAGIRAGAPAAELGLGRRSSSGRARARGAPGRGGPGIEACRRLDRDLGLVGTPHFPCPPLSSSTRLRPAPQPTATRLRAPRPPGSLGLRVGPCLSGDLGLEAARPRGWRGPAGTRHAFQGPYLGFGKSCLRVVGPRPPLHQGQVQEQQAPRERGPRPGAAGRRGEQEEKRDPPGKTGKTRALGGGVGGPMPPLI